MISKITSKLKYQMQTAKMRWDKKHTKKTVEAVPNNRCCGCGGCKNVCPVDAITMEEDVCGFLVPRVNQEKCIHCGLCLKKCPVIDKHKETEEKPKVYALWAPEEIRKKSSSGGMFSLLAEQVFENKGVVCGAAFNENWEVAHKVIEDPAQLEELRGAKYVQSDIGLSYRQVKEVLTQGRKVLFSGCPCQVAALKSYLGKAYDNLLTVDLVCHGVPSPMAFRKYIEEMYGKENLESFAFRTKEKGYSCTVLKVKLKGEEVCYPSLKEKDPYEKAFHGSYALRKACENCKFALIPRQGDITIGDYWGISDYDKSLSDGKGTSVVLVNSKKGEEIFEKVRGKANMVQETPLEAATRKNRFGVHVPVPQQREAFLKTVAEEGFLKAAKQYFGD